MSDEQQQVDQVGAEKTCGWCGTEKVSVVVDMKPRGGKASQSFDWRCPNPSCTGKRRLAGK